MSVRYVLLLSGLLTALPLTLLSLLGSHRDTRGDNFAFTFYDAAEQQRIAAYAPLVTDCQRGLGNLGRLSKDKVRGLARRWVNGAKSGALRPLLPVAFDDTSGEIPVKNEICRATGRTVEVLNWMAQSELTADPDQASRDALLALQVAAVTAGFDLGSVRRARTYQNFGLTTLAMSLSRSATQIRTVVLNEAPKLLVSPERLAQLCAYTRDLFVRRRIDMGQSLSAVQELQKALPLKDLADPDLAKTERLLKSLYGQETELDRARLLAMEREAFAAVRKGALVAERLSVTAKATS